MVTISTSRGTTHLNNALNGRPASEASPDLLQRTAMMGYHDAFLVAAILMVIPFILSFTIRDKTVSDEMEYRLGKKDEASKDLAAVEA
jgi:hypothetical protein